MRDRPLVIGVAGGSGSGKSTVVREIVRGVAPEAVSLVHQDAYYRDYGHLPPERRAAINFDHPDALESDLLAQHVDQLVAGRAIDMPVYDFHTHTRSSRTVRIEPTRVVVVDGILVLADDGLRERMDVRIFVETDADIRLIRRIRRDIAERGRTVESVVEQYERTVRPMHRDFVEPSRRWADLIVPEGGYNRVAVDMLVTKMASILAGP